MIEKDQGQSENGLEALLITSNHSHLHNHLPHLRKKSDGRIFVPTGTCFTLFCFSFTSEQKKTPKTIKKLKEHVEKLNLFLHHLTNKP